MVVSKKTGSEKVVIREALPENVFEQGNTTNESSKGDCFFLYFAAFSGNYFLYKSQLSYFCMFYGVWRLINWFSSERGWKLP